MSKWPAGKLCGLLVAIHLALDVVTACLVERHRVTPANIIFAILIGGQLSLLGICGALACRRALRRGLLVAGGLTIGTFWIWDLLLTATQSWHRGRICDYAAWICVTAVMTAFAPTLAIRWRWLELRRNPDCAPQPHRERFQFSLRQLMLLVFAAGLTLGVARALDASNPKGFDEYAFTEFCSVLVPLFSVITMVVVLAPCRFRTQWGLALLAIGMLNGLFLQLQSRHFLGYVLFVGASSCLAFATLLLVRQAGYRLVPKSELAPAPVARRRMFERQATENCGARIAQWLEHSARTADRSDDAPIIVVRG